MRSRWIGWSIVACAAATAAYGESSRRARSQSPVVRVDASAGPGPGERAASVAPPLARAAAPVIAPAPGPERAEPAPAEGDLAPLADDPALARGDRIEGAELKGLVAFTFDDGPNPETTPRVLAALEKYDVPATFFVVTRRLVGRLAEKNRQVLARQLAGGFTIASHSASHTNLESMPEPAIGREIDESLRVLAKQAERPIGLFRAPFGALDERGRAHLQQRGLTEVKWSIDSLDWRERDGDKVRERTLAAILKQEGGVVLMHDVREATARSLAGLLDDLEAANCRRLAEGGNPILPVSLHYWIRDRGKPRLVPEEVEQRTIRYYEALPRRCAARAAGPAKH